MVRLNIMRRMVQGDGEKDTNCVAHLREQAIEFQFTTVCITGQ